MGKLTILLVILTSVFLLACACGDSQRDTISAEPAEDSTVTMLNRDSDELKAIGPEGPAGAAGGFTDASPGAMEFGGRPPVVMPAATPAPAAPQFEALRSPEENGSASSPLQTAQRMVISTASISVEVEMTQAATNKVRAIAESLGGFVEQLSSSGGSERQQAHMTIRVPQTQFFTALERIEALGKVQSRNLGSEDVSEQFIDLEARLKSALRE
jgi:hypothetical protein